MVRVLMIVHEMNRGGIENFIMNLYRSVDRSKIQFDFVEHTNNKCAFDDEIEELGGVIYRCPDYRIFNHFSYVTWWKKFFSEHKEYKIVHSHLDSSANIHLRIAKKYGLTTIAHSHNSSEGFGIRAIVKSFLKIGFNNCCDFKFACSKEAGEWLFGKKVNYKVINNGINSEKYIFNEKQRDLLPKQFNVQKNELVLGHIGRLNKVKNVAFILEILKELKDLGIKAKFVSAGQGSEYDCLVKKAKALNIENDVCFLGLRNDINIIVQAFDVFVFPSFYEGLPVSVIEAQASGLKCLLSDTVSKEVDITGNVEFMSLENSPKEWAEKITSMIPYERENTQQKIIDAGYDIKTTADYLTELYIKLHNRCEENLYGRKTY